MIGPTGVGKTEISRRLAKLAQAPFLKVEATKFTEVGYVGRDVEQIIRDLLEVGIAQIRAAKRKEVEAPAEARAEERVLDALVGANSGQATRDAFRKRLRAGELNDKEIEIEMRDAGGAMPALDIPGMPGAQIGMVNLGEIFGKAFTGRTTKRRLTVAQSHDVLVAEEADKLLDNEAILRAAITAAENHGIVFLDEIDKITARGVCRRSWNACWTKSALQPPTAAAKHCASTASMCAPALKTWRKTKISRGLFCKPLQSSPSIGRSARRHQFSHARLIV
jgi:ATP-dependent HslUV protease ATP-binding subunit HslU